MSVKGSNVTLKLMMSVKGGNVNVKLTISEGRDLKKLLNTAFFLAHLS
jgi:hypothetical protein